MCRLCDEGRPQNHFSSRRNFLKSTAAVGAAAAGLNLFAARPAAADDGPPADMGRPGRRVIIRGGSVMSMDPQVGDFPQADVLIEGKKILAVGRNLFAGNAAEIDARGRIVMPGFIDTHHHQFETALRSFLADGVLINDGTGSPSGSITYFEFILNKFAPVYRPQDVYINEVFGGLSQLDDGVTTVLDVSQIHHSPQHSDAAIKALFDTGRRAAFGYFESAGAVAGNQYPSDAPRIKKQWFSSSDQLVHMIMGGEVYLGDPTTDQSWTIGRQLGLQIAAHILSPFGIRPIMDKLAQGIGGNGHIGIGPDNLFIHMTGMSDMAWNRVKQVGAQVSLAVPIEMNMRHGTPPLLKLQSLGMEPSLSVDVECTLTADFFTQMRSTMNMQRVLVNQMILDQGLPPNPLVPWPTPAAGTPALLTTRDVLRFGTMNGAKALRLDSKVGSLTPGKEADVIILDATAINVAPLNQVPGAVVSLMDRTNVETVIVAGKARKWKGRLLDVDLDRLRGQLEDSRDYIFNKANIPKDLFRSN
ncbi:MAG: 5-methylthioadenosine/S-adenosylhomocysteine deaminase [Alphaproteobacteria bacterium]|jgi:5-methylthioadenosine/S-adenosylhomocysteine deaminase|nr:5-methylthioadenosine/S-adenosylhomocysteine deaminase [Alphaproteobacteria bacterium]